MQALLDGVPIVMVQCGVVAAWGILVAGGWGLATALLVAGAVNGFDWFGRVAGAVITEAPGTRAWMRATSRLAGGGDLMHLPDGRRPGARRGARRRRPGRATRCAPSSCAASTAVHDDGTIGVSDVDLTVGSRELVLLLGQVGSGKSSLLVGAGRPGLQHRRDPLERRAGRRPRGLPAARPGRPRRPGAAGAVRHLHRQRRASTTPTAVVLPALETARMLPDVESAGGPDALVGHRGVRLSGGQVQRLALARGLACDAELLLADDVSSALDAATEIELWSALRARGATVIGATSKRAALAQADRVVVLVEGRVAAVGPWAELAGSWGHLAG